MNKQNVYWILTFRMMVVATYTNIYALELENESESVSNKLLSSNILWNEKWFYL